MPANRRPSRPCLQCGAALLHVPRQPDERRTSVQVGHHHYRCPVPACGWDGWLPRRSREAVGGLLRRRQAATHRRWLVPALTALTVTAGATALGVVAFRVLLQPLATAPRQTSLAPGEYDDGRPLPAAHPLRRYVVLQLNAESRADATLPQAEGPTGAGPAAPGLPSPLPAPVSAPGLQDSLTYRHGCVWGQPGRNPYRGTVEQALRASALPAEVVQKITNQVRAGSATDRVAIGNDGIRAASSGRVFDASHFAMTYGMTLCTSTRVNFVAGHVEQASLFEASDNKGRVYAVMVPDVCGNVSVLADAQDRRRTTAVAGSSEDAEPDLRAGPADGPEAGRAAGGPGVAGFQPGGGAPDSGRVSARGLAATRVAGVAGAVGAQRGTEVADNAPRRLPDELAWKEPASTTQGRSEGTRELLTVPEPGTLACVLLALAAMGGVARRRQRPEP
jgi:hypothetical protein